MAVVCIAGITRGIGKTSVAEMLLGPLRGWHVARVRVADEIAGPDEARLGGAEHVLLIHPADTADDPEARRFLAAGASGVSVLLAQPRGLKDGLEALRQSVPQGTNILVEGNAYLWAAEADLAVMVIGPGRSGKGLAPVRPSVRELFTRVGVWVWNARTSATEEGFFEFPQAIARMGCSSAVGNQADFHHVNPTRDDSGNAPFIEAVRQRVERDWVRRGSDEFLRRIGFGPTGQP